MVLPMVDNIIPKQIIQYTDASKIDGRKWATWILANNYIEQEQKIWWILADIQVLK
jgi:hypothetical protein